MAFTREDYNSIVRQINELAENPDDGCDPLPPLPEVPPGSKWRKSDIQAAQNLLKQICDENTFSALPALWKQFIVDELNEAIGRGWCGCDEDCKDEDGTEFLLFDNGPPTVVSDCLGNNDPDIPLRDLISGMAFGREGVFGRIWRVFQRNHPNSGGETQNLLASGVISCEGIVAYSGSAVVDPHSGVFVSCSDCHSQVCEDTLALAATLLDDPGTSYQTYHLVIDARGGVCGDCEPLPGEDDE